MKENTSSRTGQPARSLAEILAYLASSVSASRLSLFHACRLRFFFRHVLGIARPKAAALHLGATVHQTLRAWNRARWQGRESSFGSMYTEYEETWIMGQAEEPVAWESPTEAEQQKQVGWRLLETFLRETSLLTSSKPEAVEVPVEADLSSHGLPRLVGVLDLVQDGRIIDFKTVGQTPTPEKAALLHATQVAAYSLLYRANTGQRESAIELHHLVKLKQPRLVVIDLPPPDEAQLTRLYRVIESYVRGVERQDFVPSPGLHCATCEFQRECAAWH